MHLNVVGSPFELTGYGELARLFVRSFRELGHSISLINLRETPEIDEVEYIDRERILELFQCLDTPFDPRSPTINVCTPPEYKFRFSSLNVGIALFEALIPPQFWLLCLNHMDLVLTCSEFNRVGFMRSGLPGSKIGVICPPVDVERFRPDVDPLYCFKVRPFTILFVGQLTLRKGWDRLLRAAIREFQRDGDVCVLLKLPPMEYDKALIYDAIKEFGSRRKVPILVSTQALSLESLPKLFQVPRKKVEGKFYPNCSNGVRGCLAIPSLGEGITLPYLEAMASGLLTIGTHATGQSVFLDSTCSVPVETTGFVRSPELERERPLYRSVPLLNVSDEAIRASLRRAYEMSIDETEKLTGAAFERVQTMTVERTAQEALTQIVSRL